MILPAPEKPRTQPKEKERSSLQIFPPALHRKADDSHRQSNTPEGSRIAAPQHRCTQRTGNCKANGKPKQSAHVPLPFLKKAQP